MCTSVIRVVSESYLGNGKGASCLGHSSLTNELKQATLLSTQTSGFRGGTGLKTVFVPVCGNLQHI
jgi:hypothetical protein